MKRPSKMINSRRSSSKACHAAAGHVFEQAEAVKFASLHEEDEAARLRQNPIKECRVSSIRRNVVNNEKKFVCNKCGKAFQSSKAMCGHMACHSKVKFLSNVSVKRKLMMEMELESDSDTESGNGWLRKTRYKKKDCGDDSEVELDVVNNCSSEVSVVEQEQEEVAVCLMMLSRDSSNWGGLNSVGDLSGNSSVVLEDQSIGTKLGKRNGLSSKYVRNEVKVSSLRKNKLEEEPHLSLKKLKTLMDGEKYNQIQRPKAELFTSKTVLNECDIARMCMRVEQKTPVLSQLYRPFQDNVTCNKDFTMTYPYDSSQNSFVTEAYGHTRKGKGVLDDNSGNVSDNYKKGKYYSPACSKDFGSGHDFGYHWQVHLAKGFQDIKCDEIAGNSKPKGQQFHEFIDLNLPAPMDDEEANESMGSY